MAPRCPTAWRQDDAEDVVQAKDLQPSPCRDMRKTWASTWVAGGKDKGPSAGKELMQWDLTTTGIAIGCGEDR